MFVQIQNLTKLFLILAILTTDISNRHPLIIGLKNILKMITQFDISSLSIPLLVLPDRFNNEQRDSIWLQKRGEVVMKCIKGFLIENSRSGKRVQNEGLDRAESMGGGGMRNIEFLLPSQPDIYGRSSSAAGGNKSAVAAGGAGAGADIGTTTAASGTTPNTPNSALTGGAEQDTMTGAAPQEVEIAFQQFRTLLVNLFRTS